MKKKILFGISIVALSAIISLNLRLVKGENHKPESLISITKTALADDEGVENCPGGSCTYTTYFAGEIVGVCTACCPIGKDPECDEFGCECN